MGTQLFEPQDLARASPLLAVFILCQMILRFLLVVVIAKEFGMGNTADVLFIAQFIPISAFLQNRRALMLAFVPVYTEYIAKAGKMTFGSSPASLPISCCARDCWSLWHTPWLPRP